MSAKEIKVSSFGPRREGLNHRYQLSKRLTWHTAAELIREIVDEVVVNSILGRAQYDDWSRVFHFKRTKQPINQDEVWQDGQVGRSMTYTLVVRLVRMRGRLHH